MRKKKVCETIIKKKRKKSAADHITVVMTHVVVFNFAEFNNVVLSVCQTAFIDTQVQFDTKADIDFACVVSLHP